MRYLEPTPKGRYTGRRDTLEMPLWRREIPYRTLRERLEERSTTGRDPFAKRSSSRQSVINSEVAATSCGAVTYARAGSFELPSRAAKTNSFLRDSNPISVPATFISDGICPSRNLPARG